MNLSDRIKAFENDSRVLERIVSQYAEDSDEYAVLERAAIALWYVLTEDYERFKAYYQDWKKGELTTEQRAQLRGMGIDPDADADADNDGHREVE